jgi:hypothetical protein
MSDSSQGPGWWIASDGKWYSPELHPDVLDADAERDPSDSETADTEPADTEPDTPEPAEPESVEPQRAVAEPDDVEPDEAVGASQEDEAVEEDDAVAEDADADDEAPTESNAPVYLSAAAAATTPAATGVAESWTPTTYSQPPVEEADGPPVEGEAVADDDTMVVTATTNIVAGLVALIGAALIVVGSFLPWGTATGLLSGTVDGFDSNGIGTLVAGVALAASAGLLIAGVRHWLMLLAVLVSSITAIGLAVYSMFDITGSASDKLVEEVIAVTGQDAAAVAAAGTGLDVGYGLWMVLAGGTVGLISAMFVRFNE